MDKLEHWWFDSNLRLDLQNATNVSFIQNLEKRPHGIEMSHTRTHTNTAQKSFPVFSSFNITFISMLCIVYKEFKTSVDELKKINQAGRKSAWKVQRLERAWGEQARQRVRRNTAMIKVPPSLQTSLSPWSPPSTLQPANKCPFNFRWIIKDKVRMSLFFHIMQLWETSQSVMFALHREIEKER